jgi:hypothetical protein
MMDEDTKRLMKRLIDAWDDDLGELIRLIELVMGVRRRGMAFEREMCARLAEVVAEDYRTADAPAGVNAATEIVQLIRERI